MRLLFAALLLFSIPAFAQVYKWTDENGNVHFGNQPPPGEREEVHIRESKTGPMVTDGQRRMMENRERERRVRDVERRFERIQRDDSPDYICTGAKNSVKNAKERWDNVKRQGYSQSDRNYYEQLIRERERHRDNVCR